MMHLAMLNYKNVIIVLSKGYKEKSEKFKGGVGEEYALIIKDIAQHPKKYILVSFEGINNDIAPLGLQGRDTIDLSDTNNLDRLYRKLMDVPEYEFSDVAPEKPVLTQKGIPSFHAAVLPEPPIKINDLIVNGTDASMFASLYKYANFEMQVEIMNAGNSTISEYSVEVRLPKQLISNYHQFEVVDGLVSIPENSTTKLFKGQRVRTKPIPVTITAAEIRHIINATISVIVYSDSGTAEKNFLCKDVFTMRHQYGLDPIPLSVDIFHQ
jgi:hypothetical protein